MHAAEASGGRKKVQILVLAPSTAHDSLQNDHDHKSTTDSKHVVFELRRANLDVDIRWFPGPAIITRLWRRNRSCTEAPLTS